MRLSKEKSKFFKESVEYLGFVSRGGKRTYPEKVQATKSFRPLRTFFNLRSFLGLASYYRCFIKGFTTIARPLTNWKVGANQSRKIEINLNEAQKAAFDRLKNILASEEVTLIYFAFSKPFDLTTDSPQRRIGAVL